MRAAAAAALALPLTAGVAHAATPSASAAPATAAAPAAPGGSASHLRAMTFNLRYASDTRPNSWAERRPVMRTLLRRERPHLLGTQEGVYSQIRDIAQDLGPRYDWIGTGREGGSRGEFMAVFYDTQRLAPLEYDHFWLSGTPYVIGSNTWGNAVVRMATWVRFRDLRGGGQFYALNTHFDHRNQSARERSADLVAERLRG
ncbi:endonuclease/exonuclease/phosphatase family protein, partial [Streptomyces sp. AC563]